MVNASGPPADRAQAVGSTACQAMGLHICQEPATHVQRDLVMGFHTRVWCDDASKDAPR